MWQTVNSVYKSANKNIKKLGKNMPKMSAVSQSIQKINIQKLIPKLNTKQQTEVQKVLSPIFKNKKPVMPINKMSAVAEISYQSQKFQEICDFILQKLKVFKYQAKSAKQTLNTLILLSYLIKNAASGFVDEFRQEISIFQQHSELKIENAYINDEKEIQKLKTLLIQIRQRAKYIAALLTDKRKLLKQKQVAMEIKRKIMENSKNAFRQEGGNPNQKIFGNSNLSSQSEKDRQISQKMESFLQHYVWKYWNKFDEKMENITERIIQRIDQYLDMDQPQSFQIDQLEQTQISDKPKNQTNIQQSTRYEQQVFLRQKNEILGIQVDPQGGPVLNTELV